MKKLTSILFIGLIAFLFACGGGANQDQTESQSTENQNEKAAADYSDMESHDLSSYDIPAQIYLPGNMGKPDMNLTDWGSLEIRIGENYGLEIVPFGLLLSEKKAELEADLVYQINYLEEKPDLLVYEKSIQDSDVDPEYHFFINREIAGEVYEIKSLAALSMKKAQMEKVLKAAKSFEAK